MPFVPFLAQAAIGLGVGALAKGAMKKLQPKPSSQEQGLALLQRREMADADAERKKLLQEKTSIVGGGRFRRRGGGLSTYSGAA